MNGAFKLPIDKAAVAAMAAKAAAAPPPPAPSMHPVVAFQQYFALPVPVLQALKPSVTQCLCGRCQGVGVQLEARMHFTPEGPQLIERGDAAREPTK